MQPFQTSLQRHGRALLAPDMTERLLPGLGTKVRHRRIIRSVNSVEGVNCPQGSSFIPMTFATFFLPLAEMHLQVQSL